MYPTVVLRRYFVDRILNRLSQAGMSEIRINGFSIVKFSYIEIIIYKKVIAVF